MYAEILVCKIDQGEDTERYSMQGSKFDNVGSKKFFNFSFYGLRKFVN